MFLKGVAVALKPCSECGAQVSHTAKTCPKCGVKTPVKNHRTIWLVFLLFLLLLLVFIASRHPSDTSPSSPPSAEQPAPKYTSPSLDSMPKGNVVADRFGAVICPGSKAFDAFDAAQIRVAGTNLPATPDVAAIWLDTAKPNGCNYVRPGTALVSEGESSDSGGNGPLATVTAQMPDGTTIEGVTLPTTMLYSIPKGNVTAASVGAIICPNSKAITAYQDAVTAWESNEPNMSAEKFRAAKSSLEGLAKSAGCNYVPAGTSLISAGEIEVGGIAEDGSGANLNPIVTAKMPDGTTVGGLTLRGMITQNQQQPTALAGESSSTQPQTPQEPETQQEQTPDGSIVPKDTASEVQTFKGHCLNHVCDSIALIYPAEYRDYVMIVFLQGNSKVFGFSGRLYFDSVDGDTKVMVDHLYSPGGEIHVYHPNGEESAQQKPVGWEAHEGVCEFSFRVVDQAQGVDCGQPMWSFLVASGQPPWSFQVAPSQ